MSTGAVSKGDYDFVPAALKQLGATIIFHRVAIKPGKPILFALMPNGDCFFGLPGNPIASAVGFRFFVMPLLRAMLGLAAEHMLRATLTADHKAKPGLRQFLKAHCAMNAPCEAQVTILPGQRSFKIKPMADANGWAVLDETTNHLDEDDLIDFVPAAPWGWA